MSSSPLTMIVLFLFAAMTTLTFMRCNSNPALRPQLPEFWMSDLRALSLRDDKLRSLLDSLADRERMCGYYEESLTWVIIIQEEGGDTTMTITMVRGYPSNYGYFYIDDALFVANGMFLESLFTKEDSTRTFTEKAELPRPETFSTWIYNYRNSGIVLKDAWPFPCRK